MDPENEVVDAATTVEKPEAVTTPAADAGASDKGGGAAAAEPKSILDAVVAAVAEKSEPVAAPAPVVAPVADAGEGHGGSAAAEPAKAADPTDAELAALPEPVRNTVRAAITARDAANARIQELTQPATVGGQLTDYMAKNGLDFKEVNGVLSLGTLLKSDPEAAYKALIPVFDNLLTRTGRKLSPDLAQRVKEGLISQEDALTQSRALAAKALAEGRVEQVTTETESRTAADAAQKLISDISVAVSRWETGVKGHDPDFPLYAKDIVAGIKLRHYENGPPKTAAEAVEMAKAVYKEVKANYAKVVPLRKPVETPAAQGQGTRAAAKPKPTTSLEAIQQAVG